jgi:hypothetical protein
MYDRVKIVTVLKDGEVENIVIQGDPTIVIVDFDAIGESGQEAQEALDAIGGLGDVGLPGKLAGVAAILDDIVREDPPEDNEDFDDDDEEEDDDPRAVQAAQQPDVEEFGPVS